MNKWFNKLGIKKSNKVLNNYIQKLENELYSTCEYDDKTVKRKIKFLITKLVIIDILLVIMLGLIYGINVCMIFITCFAVYLVNKTLIEKSFNEENVKILYQMPEMIDELKSSYYEKRMIDESLSLAIEGLPYEISQKCEKIRNVLTSSNIKIEVEKYNRECNNKFLKLLMNILYIAKEYGDKNLNEGDNKTNIKNSVFIKNLNYLLEEVNIEITKQNLFKMKFSGLIFVTIFPLLFINLVEKWSVSNFEILSTFYESFAGFILKNITVLVCIFASLLIVKIKDSQTNIEIVKNKFNLKNNSIKNSKNKKLEKMIGKLIPDKKSKQYILLSQKIDEAKIELTPDKYYKDKILYCILAMLCMLVMFISANTYLDVVTGKTLFIELFSMIVIGLLATLIVDFNIFFEKNIKKANKENEINNFRSIILILIHYSFVSAEEILVYLEKYSYIYKNEIRRCLNDYEKDGEYAISKIRNEVKEKSLKKLFRSLLQCVKNITVQQAFSFLESERDFYKEETKNKNMQEVNEKTNLAQMVSQIPYYTLILLYFITPMVYTGMKELSSLLMQIKNM
ncbi:MAG: hypothetical protein MJ245_00030 [Clostridia bacterium]|nr:hypothetical protein [Clostridia bacterium]